MLQGGSDEKRRLSFPVKESSKQVDRKIEETMADINHIQTMGTKDLKVWCLTMGHIGEIWFVNSVMSIGLLVGTLQLSHVAYASSVPTTHLSQPTAMINASLPSIQEQQLILAKLDYLPFKVNGNQLVWTYKLPSSLTTRWKYGTDNVVFQGAVMQFQHHSGITVDGVLGEQTWTKLRYAYRHHLKDPYGYAYVFISEKLPETLTLYYNGKVVLRSLTNTGVKGAETPIGTFPVYLRYLSQTMQGTDVNSTHYVDPGVPYVNYFTDGCAVHGFNRENYGFPQSLGCVELPYAAAKTAWGYIHYGTLVTVTL